MKSNCFIYNHIVLQILYILICFSVSGISNAQCIPSNTSNFVKIIGTAGDDESYSLVELSNREIIVAGTSTINGQNNKEHLLFKLDTLGKPKWIKLYGKSKEETAPFILKKANKIYVLGKTRSFTTGVYTEDVIFYEIDQNGQLQGNIKRFERGSRDRATMVINTLDDGFIISGNDEGAGSLFDDLDLIKIDQNQTVQWYKQYRLGGETDVGSIHQKSDSSYVIFSIQGNAPSQRNIGIYRVSSNGNIIDYREIIASNEEGGRNAVLLNNYFYFVGYTRSFGSTNKDAFILKLDINANPVWLKTYGGNQDDEFRSISATCDGKLIISGNTKSFGFGGNDIILTKIDTNGAVQFASIFGSNANEKTSSFEITQTFDNGYLLSGYTTGMGAIGKDIFVIKTDQNGKVADSCVFQTIQFPLKKQLTSLTIIYRNPNVVNTGKSHINSLNASQISICPINPCGLPTDTQNISICLGDSIFLEGGFQNTPGLYYDTLISILNCDSVEIITNLHVISQLKDTTFVTICSGDKYNVGGQWQTKPGWYIDSLLSKTGCDSIIHTNLIVFNGKQTNLDTIVCPGSPVIFAGQIRYVSGTFTDTLTTMNGCDSIVTFTLNHFPAPKPNIGSDTSFCINDSIVLTAGNHSSYLWNTGSNDSTLIVKSPGIYWLSVTNKYGCFGYDSIMIIEKKRPIVDFGSDRFFCPDDSVVLDVFNQGAQYLWNTFDTSFNLSIKKPGLYSVIVNLNGCIESDSIVLSLYDKLLIDIGNDTSFCLGGYITINMNTTNAINYEWSHGPTSSMVDLYDSGTYFVTITDNNNCKTVDSIRLDVTFCEPSLFIPNAFSPNGDGLNDFFTIRHQNIKLIEFRVFNRWGQQIYYASDINFSWDGYLNGEPLSSGVYVYWLSYIDDIGRPFSKQGNITLLR
jgi:gliding motility-associated-like protein